MKKFVTICICALSLVACGTEEQSKNTQETVQSDAKKAAVEAAPAAMTESQVFAYILGREFGLPSYLNQPSRIGAMLDLDAMVQGIVDNASVLKDTNRVLQLSQEEQKKIEIYYAKVKEDRRVAGENAAPVALAGPITGGKVILSDTTSPIVKYSYMQGVQVHMLFTGLGRTFGEEFDTHYFILGLRESVFAEMDPSFKKSVPEDTLKAVNSRYVERINKIREEQRRQ